MSDSAYRRKARAAARQAGIDPDLFVRQIAAESNFNPNAKSPAGALGIAQIMPATARGWGVDPLDPDAALQAAAQAMAKYVADFGSYEDALRAYNAGPGAVEQSRGYAETNNYVKKILGRRGEPGQPKRRSGEGKPFHPTAPGPDAPEHSEFDAVMALVEDKIDPLQFAQTVKANRDFEAAASDPGIAMPDTPDHATPRRQQTPHLPGSLQGLAETTRNIFQRMGAAPTSSHRTEQRNAEVGGAEDSDHLWHRGGRWGEDYDLTGDSATAGARKAAKRFGIHEWDGQGLTETVIEKGRKSYRVQIINEGDHVHVGIREM